MKIIARNLSRETTQAELTALFAEFGLVESCTLVLDKDTGVIRVKVAEEVAPK